MLALTITMSGYFILSIRLRELHTIYETESCLCLVCEGRGDMKARARDESQVAVLYVVR